MWNNYRYTVQVCLSNFWLCSTCNITRNVKVRHEEIEKICRDWYFSLDNVCMIVRPKFTYSYLEDRLPLIRNYTSILCNQQIFAIKNIGIDIVKNLRGAVVWKFAFHFIPLKR